MRGKETLDQRLARWDRIFDGIKKNESAESIYRREDEISRRRFERWANKRGEVSEKRFVEAISHLRQVKEINQTQKYSPEDWHLKVDVWVVADFENYGSMALAVQVKSSDKGIRDFLRTYIDKDLDKAWEKLATYGMVVINGQLEPSKIRSEFLHQVKVIQKENPRAEV